MNMKRIYPYALHAIALSSILSIAAMLPAAAQQPAPSTAAEAKAQAMNAAPRDSASATKFISR